MERTYTVLIVDDNLEDRFILKRYLAKTTLPLVVLEASGGLEGIELLTTQLTALREKYPDISAPVILFLDINMPRMNGWEFVEELHRQRKEIALKPTIVMMYSTSGADVEKRRAETYDTVSNYIVKGESTPETLKQTILSSVGVR